MVTRAGEFTWTNFSPVDSNESQLKTARLGQFSCKQFCKGARRAHITILKNSLIIQEQNTKKNHKRVVVLYVIKNHVNLHKL
jgi:hypothetical protein